LWAPIWRQLTSDASLKVRKTNYERIFDAARLRVRAWERANRALTVPVEERETTMRPPQMKRHASGYGC
jgi:hypothetical protein